MSKRPLLSSVCACLSLLAVSCSSSPKSTAVGLQFVSPTSPPIIYLGQNVSMKVSAPGNDTLTWKLLPGTGFGKSAGTLTANGDSATYTAPAALNPPPACTGTPTSPLEESVTVSDGSGNVASMIITILQALPCVATTPSVPVCVSTPTATTCSNYPPPGTTNIACPAAGALMLGAAQVGIQPLVAGSYGSVVINDGGGSSPNGLAPFTWTVSSGTLPAGLSLVAGPNPGSAFIEGTPVAPGCSVVTLQIQDSLGASGTAPFFVVVVPPALKVKSGNNSLAFGGVSYLSALTATGGVPPYAWAPAVDAVSVNPNSPEDLPPDLTLTFPQSSSGNALAVISGTPNPQDIGNPVNNGSYTLYLQVSDSQSPYPAIGSPSWNSIGVFAANPVCQAGNGLTAGSGYGGSPSGGSVAFDAFLQGSYALLLHGFDANGPVAMAASIQADGTGKITSGEGDVTRTGGSQTVTIIPAGSSYTVGPEANTGCLVLQDSSGVTTTFGFTLGGCSNNYTLPETGAIGPSRSACGIMANGQGVNVPAGYYTSGRLIVMDSSGTHLSGILRLQDPSSFAGGVTGQYAFGINGWDSAGKHYAAAGSVQASSGSFSSVAADINDGGNVASSLTGGSGSIGSPDLNGRASGTITVGSANYSLAMYIVSQNEVMMATTDLLSSSHPIASGEAIATAGPFSSASLQDSHMFHLGGVTGTNPDAEIGLVTFDGIGGFTGKTYEDQAATLGVTTASGAYTVDSNTGRTAFNTSQTNQPLVHPFVAYIIPTSLTRANCTPPAACVTGFLVGADATAQDGILEFQTPSVAPPPPFNNDYLLGDFTFGVDEALDGLTAYSEGYATAAPSSSASTAGTLNGTQDHNYSDSNYCLQANCTPLVPGEIFAGSYTINSDGTGSFGGFNGETVSVTNGRVIFYLDESPLNLHPAVVVAEQ